MGTISATAPGFDTRPGQKIVLLYMLIIFKEILSSLCVTVKDIFGNFLLQDIATRSSCTIASLAISVSLEVFVFVYSIGAHLWLVVSLV